jgi:hypothetical protein
MDHRGQKSEHLRGGAGAPDGAAGGGGAAVRRRVFNEVLELYERVWPA